MGDKHKDGQESSFAASVAGREAYEREWKVAKDALEASIAAGHGDGVISRELPDGTMGPLVPVTQGTGADYFKHPKVAGQTSVVEKRLEEGNLRDDSRAAYGAMIEAEKAKKSWVKE